MRQNGRIAAIPSGPRVDGLAVKPHGIRRNKTFLAANDARPKTIRNSRAENREFFQNRPPYDGPRSRPTAVPVHDCDNDAIVRGDAACRAPSPDSDEPPATATIFAPPFCKRRCNTAIEGEPDKTTDHSPLTDTSAGEPPCDDAQCPLLAFSVENNHAEEGPREDLLPTVKSRSGTTYSAPGRF